MPRKYDLICEYCGADFQSTHKDTATCSKRCTGKRRGLKMVDKNIYEHGWNENNAYVFGLIMSDGCLMTKGEQRLIAIVMNDLEILERVHALMQCKRKIYKQNKSNKILYWNENAVEFLEGFGLKERKSLTKRYPTNIPAQYQRDFIRGYFDGNGSAVVYRAHNSRYYGRILICSGSKDFLDVLQLTLEENNIASTVRKDKKIGSSWKIDISKLKEEKKFIDFIYYQDVELFLERKFNKSQEIKKMELIINIA